MKQNHVRLGAFTLAEAKQKGRLVFGKEVLFHQLFLLMSNRPHSTLVIFSNHACFQIESAGSKKQSGR